MADKQTLEMAEEARICLKEAVHAEMVKKAMLGQDVIIDLGDGKPSRVSAAEALRMQEKSTH